MGRNMDALEGILDSQSVKTTKLKYGLIVVIKALNQKYIV